QFDAAFRRPMAQQLIRHLDHAAGAVADQRIRADRAAVIEVDEDLQAALDDVVRFSAFDVNDKADAARIMLVARIVESPIGLRCRHFARYKPSFFGRSALLGSLGAKRGRDTPFWTGCMTKLGKANRGCEPPLVFY